MAWTYDPLLFGSITVGYYTGSTIGQRYQIRLLTQDTQTTRQLLQDEEIDWYQTQEMNVYMMAAAAAESLVSRGGNMRAKKISEFFVAYDPRFYQELARFLRARGSSYQVPYAGGISIMDKLLQELDGDWVTPKIFRGLDDNPDSPGPEILSTDPLTEL